MSEDRAFDPRAVLSELERARVGYVVIGSLARVLQGSDEIARGVDICPQLRGDNLRRLDKALHELDARPEKRRGALDLEPLAKAEPVMVLTSAGPLRLVPVPAGTRGGWDDLRRAASREALGGGLRVPVASLNDLLRMESALARPDHAHVPGQLRQLQEFERTAGRGIER